MKRLTQTLLFSARLFASVLPTHAQPMTTIMENETFSVSVGPDRGEARTDGAPVRHVFTSKQLYRVPQQTEAGIPFISVEATWNLYCLSQSHSASDIDFRDQNQRALHNDPGHREITVGDLKKATDSVYPVLRNAICWAKVHEFPDFALSTSRDPSAPSSKTSMRTVWSRLDFHEGKTYRNDRPYWAAEVNWNVDCTHDEWQASEIKVLDQDGGNIMWVTGRSAFSQIPDALQKYLTTASQGLTSVCSGTVNSKQPS